ncbi:MBL fold metallo-hydrolase [Rhodovulum sulfidophilum]|uniref:MBL fold metallo-hydrolase n=1 Tax=Rhodovulum sulfidophilum TaxID=35806 RepID=UPI0009516E9A|nr:MBL fold metallo-hydrolase [Rhodovulum sulfidophilum]OLS50969.1 MBL fold metallo-hydrolase [Rhodovulum sulfidophilum]
MTKMTRRHALLAGAALPLAAAVRPARAAAPMMGPARPPFNRFTLGSFEVTTILAGSRTVPDPQTIFGLNVAPERFAAVSEAAMIPADKAQFFFTPTVVNTGAELILFDTGLAPRGTVAALEAAGYTPDQIDTVIITHMHGDHIGGLMKNGTETFSNARYVTGAVEFDAWDMSGDESFETKMRPLAEKTRFIDDGDEAAPGVTAVAAFGHTPGHMAYQLESNGKALLLGADFANHYIWSLAHPDWEVLYDRDKEAAAATRRRLLDMLAAERMPFIGYHMPFPALGYVEKQETGYRYLPASYQMMLE